MSWLTHLTIAVAIATMPAAAPAQLAADGETFVNMVRDGDSNGALALLQSKPIIIDATDSRGDSALLAALKARDSAWAGHLIKAGANPNLPARNGDTPLIVAARAGFVDAARWLLGVGAKVDGANKMGETALIVAVQERELALVELLLAAGADPDRTDAAAGFSARDYARRQPRFPQLLAAIEASKGSSPRSDKLDDFKLN